MLFEICFNDTLEYNKLKSINKWIHDKEKLIEHNLSFDFKKSIFSNNDTTLNHFHNFLMSINVYQQISKLMIDDYTIERAYYFTPKSKEYTIDIKNSHDGLHTNILTILIPLIDSGIINYISNKKLYQHKFTKNQILIWDSCKFEYYIDPNKLPKIIDGITMKPIYTNDYIIINLSNNKLWTKKILNSN